MDSTAGDLSHAAKDLGEQIEKHSTHGSREDSSDQHSSDSSSQDVTALEKLDSKHVKVAEIKEGEEAYAHLPPHEREIVKKQLEIPPITVTFTTLYRYATRNDIIISVISAIAAIGGGAVLPLMTVR